MKRFYRVGDSGESREAKTQRQASEESLATGGLPLNAIDRLKEQASRQGKPGQIFTSNLSVNEFALTCQAGYVPLGQVMGSSIYHMSQQRMATGSSLLNQGSGELTLLTEAFYYARHNALGRLKQEATLLKATGVIGVRLELATREMGPSMLEFMAVGTAIREKDINLGSKAEGNQNTSDGQSPEREPFLSDLSGREFWMLRQSGYRPVGLALGNCTWYQINNRPGLKEHTDYTRGVYTARSLAMGRMESEALDVGACGIVGAHIDFEIGHNEERKHEPDKIKDQAETASHPAAQNNDCSNHRIIHFSAVGTAIAPFVGRWPVLDPVNFVSLGTPRDRSRSKAPLP